MAEECDDSDVIHRLVCSLLDKVDSLLSQPIELNKPPVVASRKRKEVKEEPEDDDVIVVSGEDYRSTAGLSGDGGERRMEDFEGEEEDEEDYGEEEEGRGRGGFRGEGPPPKRPKQHGRYMLPGECVCPYDPRRHEKSVLSQKARERDVALFFSAAPWNAMNFPQYDPRSDNMYWTVNMAFRKRVGNIVRQYKLEMHRVYGGDSIQAMFRNLMVSISSGSPGLLHPSVRQLILDTGLSFFNVFMEVPTWDRFRYYEVNPLNSLEENLRGKMVLDRPHFMLYLKTETPAKAHKKYVSDAEKEASMQFLTKSLERMRQVECAGTFEARVLAIREYLLDRMDRTKDHITNVTPTNELRCDLTILMNHFTLDDLNHPSLAFAFMNKLKAQFKRREQKYHNLLRPQGPPASLELPGHPPFFEQLAEVVDTKDICKKGIHKMSKNQKRRMRQQQQHEIQQSRLNNMNMMHPDRILPPMDQSGPPRGPPPFLHHGPGPSFRPGRYDPPPFHQVGPGPAFGPRPPLLGPAFGPRLSLGPAFAPPFGSSPSPFMPAGPNNNPFPQQINNSSVARPPLKIEPPEHNEKDDLPFGDAPSENRKGRKITVIGGAGKNAPNTFRDFVQLEDMVCLPMYRSLSQVSQRFESPSNVLFLENLRKVNGRSFGIVEDVQMDPDSRVQMVRASVCLERTIRLTTLGQARSPSIRTATLAAYSGLMCSLSYMLVVPYEMYTAIKEGGAEGKDWIESVAYACRFRIRQLIMLSETLEFMELAQYSGDLPDAVPQRIFELWQRFMHRMRSNGVRYWSRNRVVKVPHGIDMPDPSSYGGRYFRFERDESDIDWSVMLPQRGILDREVLECPMEGLDRYGEQGYEVGMVPHHEHLEKVTRCPLTGAANWQSPSTSMPRDWVVWLTARDFEVRGPFSAWVHVVNHDMVDGIGLRWNKLVMRQRSVIQESDGNSSMWFHVTTIKVDGIPPVFLQGTGKHADIRVSTALAESQIVSSLCLMGIIPRELYQLICVHGKEWIDPVLHACRHRFSALETQCRQACYSGVSYLREARLFLLPHQAPNPQLVLLYSFFERIRATSTAFWNANPVIAVPRSIPLPKSRLSWHYFVFVQSDSDTDWSSMSSRPFERDPSSPSENELMRSLSQCFVRWQLNNWRDSAPDSSQGGAAAQPDTWRVAKQPVQPSDIMLQHTIKTCQPSAYSVGRIEAIRHLMEALAQIIDAHFEVEEKKDEKGMVISCTARWSGEVSWILSRTVEAKESAQNLPQLAMCALCRTLLRARLLPPGLIQLVEENTDRLPYVTYSMRGIVQKMAAIAKAYLYYEGKRVNQYTMCQMREECERDWKGTQIALPRHMIPDQGEFSPFRALPIRPLYDNEWTTQSRFQKLNLMKTPSCLSFIEVEDVSIGMKTKEELEKSDYGAFYSDEEEEEADDVVDVIDGDVIEEERDAEEGEREWAAEETQTTMLPWQTAKANGQQNTYSTESCQPDVCPHDEEDEYLD